QRDTLKFRVARSRILHLASGSSGIAWDIAWPHHSWEYKFISASLIFQQLEDGERDLNFAVGRNIGYGLGEDVGTLLIEQGRCMSGSAGGIKDLARLIAFLDHSLDFAFANLHGHAVYGAVMRQGE